VIVRRARSEDLPAIVDMLSDDMLGKTREDPGRPLNEAYLRAFDAIETDPNNDLLIGEVDGTVMAMMQFTVLPSISFTGRPRAQIESVRVAEEMRGRGYGRQLFEWGIAEAKRRDCHLVQLATNAQRTDAKRFYEDLGFVPSHIGMKMAL